MTYDSAVESIRQLRDARERAEAVRALFQELERARSDLNEVRDRTIEELADGGVANVEIARLLGVTRARITQIRSYPERR